MKSPQILLADDHVLLMDAIRKLLEPEFEVVGTVSDGKALIATAMALRPDLIVLDLGLPLLNGMDAGRRLKMLLPRARLLVVTMNEDVGIAVRALREWASGFLLKKCAGTELLVAIREVLRGHTYVTPRMAQQLQREFIRGPELSRRQGSHAAAKRSATTLGRRAHHEGSRGYAEPDDENRGIPQVQHHAGLQSAQQSGFVEAGNP